MSDQPRDLRISSTLRGVFVALVIAIYAWVFRQPGASWTQMLLVGAALQAAVLLLRRFVPRDRLPQAMYVFELVVDGITVLVFALGVFGGIVRMPQDL